MTNSNSVSSAADPPVLLARGIVLPFILVTSLFALWGFANDVTNPLVKAFKDVFVISNTQSSLVQTAFYGGYATMALPAALFIRRFSYKAGIIVGLLLYATGALISLPAAAHASFNLFLVSLYVLTFGLAFLETTANPFILSMGHPATATRRLNLAQAFNPIGSLTGMTVASLLILANLQVETFRTDVRIFRSAVDDPTMAAQAAAIDPSLRAYLESQNTDLKAKGSTLADLPYDTVLDRTMADYQSGKLAQFQGVSFQQLQRHDLDIVKMPYVMIGLVVLGVMLVFVFSKMPDTGHDTNKSLKLSATFGRLLRNKCYVEGVFAQAFYVGAQIMCWTFIIHYATTNLGMTASQAQNYNIVAMFIFCCSRFVCTFLLKYVSPGRPADVPCLRRHDDHVGRDFPVRHGGALQPDWHFGLHVVDVPDHLRHRTGRHGRGCQDRLGRPHLRDCGRRIDAAAAGPNHRSGAGPAGSSWGCQR